MVRGERGNFWASWMVEFNPQTQVRSQMWWLALEIPATLSWKFKSQLTSSTQHISRNQKGLGVGWFFTPSKSSPGSLGESERRTQQKTPLIFPFFSPCRLPLLCGVKSNAQEPPLSGTQLFQSSEGSFLATAP